MNKISHYVLANSLTWSGVHLVFDQWFKQTLCVSHFTDIILSSYVNGPVNKSRYNMLDHLLVLLGDHYA